MQKVNGYPLWLLGYHLGLFSARLTPNALLKAVVYDASVARRTLEQFSTSNARDLRLSIDAAKPLLASIVALIPDLETPARNLDQPIPEEESNNIWRNLLHFNSVLSTELPRANVFLVTQKCAWDTTTLIESGELVLPSDLTNLSEDTQRLLRTDIRESTRCLAFDIPTAVGFHVFRAVETVVLEYLPLFGKTKASFKNPSLGTYIVEMEKQGIDVKVTAMLRHLKDHYRNPVAHPELFWNPAEAAGAFGFAVSAIGVMLGDLAEEKNKRSAP